MASNRLSCLFCGGMHVYPGPRYENHLLNEHGVVFDTDYFIRLSLYKRERGSLPALSELTADKKDNSCQTDEEQQLQDDENCSNRRKNGSKFDKVDVKDEEEEGNLNDDGEISTRSNDVINGGNEGEEYQDDNMEGFSDYENDNHDDDDDDETGKIAVWFCSFCPEIFRNLNAFKSHPCFASNSPVTQNDDLLQPVKLTEAEFNRQTELNKRSPVGVTKRKPVGAEWAPNSFSSTFTCHFCNERFRKDYQLKVHLMTKHHDEDPEEMKKAKEELTKSKLDGCVHKCAICGSKYNSVANFTRHLKDLHRISRAEYREEFGSSEIESRTFRCELCLKEVKHTRNIIGAHMKQVHLISWKEYQEMLIRMRAGETVVGDLPVPELFECKICGVSVKYKREHLNKKHQIDEDVYEALVERQERGEDISKELPDRPVLKCAICDRECIDLKKHIERSHHISEEDYAEIAAESDPPIRVEVKFDGAPSSTHLQQQPANRVKRGKSLSVSNAESSPMAMGSDPKKHIESSHHISK